MFYLVRVACKDNTNRVANVNWAMSTLFAGKDYDKLTW